MPRQKLNEMLRELQTELEKTEKLDARAEREIRAVMQDIRATLDEQDANASHEGLSDRLLESLEDFEEAHPRIGLNIRRVIDALSRL